MKRKPLPLTRHYVRKTAAAGFSFLLLEKQIQYSKNKSQGGEPMKVLFLSLLFSVSPQAAAPIAEPDFQTSDYTIRYPLKNASQKLVDNRGNGYEDLYGNRNLRAVLNGIYYRGGANNYYHRTNKRNNMNPIPNDGLQNLCEEGFGKAVYLYEANYSTAPKSVSCKNYRSEDNQLKYDQTTILKYELADLRKLHSLIFDHIRNPRLGPILAHCWNGWHASGYVAATALKQFCGFTSEQAVKYWDLNTDGNNKESRYESVRRRIRSFEPDPNLGISQEEQKKICPEPKTLVFSQN